MLRYLVESQGRLVTKRELYEKVWGGAEICPAVLKVCIGEIRRALRDDPIAPRFIETVPRRGYRWIGGRLAGAPPPFDPAFCAPPGAVVGREAELAELSLSLDRARRGERQIVFLTGEAGIGKTTLVDTFLRERRDGVGDVWVAHGQCIEQFGGAEPYLPVLVALGDLARLRSGASLAALLASVAPSWAAQLSEVGGDRPRSSPLDANRERMLRELAMALEAACGETSASVLPSDAVLVLVLDDLQWSDAATVDAIAYLARRRKPARLMVIGAYRPVDVIARSHPLRDVKRELQVHRLCREIPVRLLDEASVAEFVAARLGTTCRPTGRARSRDGEDPPRDRWRDGTAIRELARGIHVRTEGNPLFMRAVIDDLVSRGILVETRHGWRLESETTAALVDVPESIRMLIEAQVEKLSADEQSLLEVASVAGMEFSPATVAAGLGTSEDDVELHCMRLASRTRMVRALDATEIADRGTAIRYAFEHSLYKEVVYRRTSAARRAILHQRIGEHLEAAYGGGRGELAAELAMHFQRGNDGARAARYRELADRDAGTLTATLRRTPDKGSR